MTSVYESLKRASSSVMHRSRHEHRGRWRAQYHLRPNLSVIAGARNVSNIWSRQIRRGSKTPKYEQQGRYVEYGVPLSLGIKGTF